METSVKVAFDLIVKYAFSRTDFAFGAKSNDYFVAEWRPA